MQTLHEPLHISSQAGTGNGDCCFFAESEGELAAHAELLPKFPGLLQLLLQGLSSGLQVQVISRSQVLSMKVEKGLDSLIVVQELNKHSTWPIRLNGLDIQQPENRSNVFRRITRRITGSHDGGRYFSFSEAII